MSNAPIQVTNVSPLPGAQLVNELNAALLALGTQFSGTSDPAANAGPYMRWADTGTGRLRMRNSAGTAWIDLGPLEAEAINPIDGALFASQAWVRHTLAKLQDLRWYVRPLGEAFPLWDHIAGADIPPTDNPDYRYIKLTASDAYNSGVLSNETVSGSAPLLTATAIVNLAGSPINGATVRLINTDQRFVRAGQSGQIQDDAIQNITGSFDVGNGNSGARLRGGSGSGAFTATTQSETKLLTYVDFSSSTYTGLITFDADKVVRTATETRGRSALATYYMRIK